MSVCFERKFLIRNISVGEVHDVCHRILREMGLKIMKEEFSEDGKTTVLAGEGALVPLITKALLNPFGLDDYVKSAQRTGIHLILSPTKSGVNLYLCGIALEDFGGKHKEYTREEVVEEVTDTLEDWEFEEKFLKKLLSIYPETKET